MKVFVKILKWLGISILGIIVIFTIALSIFLNTAPQIGQVPEGADLERISKSEHFKDGLFENVMETTVGSFSDMMETLPDFISAQNLMPEKLIPTAFGEGNTSKIDSISYLTWYGHSAFLLEMEGKKILIDPMLGDVPAPTSFGTPRYPYEEAIPIDEIKNIDVVVLSHDHYDHLDYESIIKLDPHVKKYFTPLGVGSHLKHWGVDPEKIMELDWWEEGAYEGIKFASCPARHFSGRGLFDRYTTQWASWVITGNYDNIYFSGDGGYGEHFKEIGEKYGPFDFAMMECGQYNLAWVQIHMLPEQSVQAGIDLNGKVLMPIHWGAFQLALHTWTEPIERFAAEAKKLEVDFVNPTVGKRFGVGIDYPNEEWWR